MRIGCSEALFYLLLTIVTRYVQASICTSQCVADQRVCNDRCLTNAGVSYSADTKCVRTCGKTSDQCFDQCTNTDGGGSSSSGLGDDADTLCPATLAGAVIPSFAMSCRMTRIDYSKLTSAARCIVCRTLKGRNLTSIGNHAAARADITMIKTSTEPFPACSSVKCQVGSFSTLVVRQDHCDDEEPCKRAIQERKGYDFWILSEWANNGISCDINYVGCGGPKGSDYSPTYAVCRKDSGCNPSGSAAVGTSSATACGGESCLELAPCDKYDCDDPDSDAATVEGGNVTQASRATYSRQPYAVYLAGVMSALGNLDTVVQLWL